MVSASAQNVHQIRGRGLRPDTLQYTHTHIHIQSTITMSRRPVPAVEKDRNTDHTIFYSRNLFLYLDGLGLSQRPRTWPTTKGRCHVAGAGITYIYD